MNEESFKLIMKELMRYYRHSFDDKTLDLWYRLLKDLPAEAVIKGVESMLKTRVYATFPSVAEIRKATLDYLPKRVINIISSEPAQLKEIIFECGECKQILLYKDINNVEWGRQCECNKTGRPSKTVDIRAKKMEIANTKKSLLEIFRENMLKSVN